MKRTTTVPKSIRSALSLGSFRRARGKLALILAALLVASACYAYLVRPPVTLGGPDGNAPLTARQIHSAALIHQYPDAFEAMEVAKSVEEGLEIQYLERRKPFIVRRPREFRALTRDFLVGEFLKLGKDPAFRATTYVYTPDFTTVYVTPTQMMEMWNNGTETRVIDVPMSWGDMPYALRKHNGFKPGSPLVSIQLTSKDALTPMHSDPADNGGGWINSVEGSKEWFFLPPAYLKAFGSDQQFWQAMTEGTGAEVAAMVAKQQGPKIVVARINKGDFICWPPGYMHKVFTPERFIGVGSYMLWPEDIKQLSSSDLGHLIRLVRGEPDPEPGQVVYSGSIE